MTLASPVSSDNILMPVYNKTLPVSRGQYVASQQHRAYDDGMDLEALSFNIRRLRDARGWSIERLMKLSGVDRSIISRLEHQHGKNPSQRTISALAKTFDVAPEDLTEWPVDRPRPTPIEASIAHQSQIGAGSFVSSGAATESGTIARIERWRQVTAADMMPADTFRALLARGTTVRELIRETGRQTVFVCPADWMPGAIEGQMGWVVQLAEAAEDNELVYVRWRDQFYSGRFKTDDGQRWIMLDTGHHEPAGNARVVAIVLSRCMPV